MFTGFPEGAEKEHPGCFIYFMIWEVLAGSLQMFQLLFFIYLDRFWTFIINCAVRTESLNIICSLCVGGKEEVFIPDFSQEIQQH